MSANRLLFVILSILASACVADEVDIKFAREYFQARVVPQVAAFGCWDSFGKSDAGLCMYGVVAIKKECYFQSTQVTKCANKMFHGVLIAFFSRRFRFLLFLKNGII